MQNNYLGLSDNDVIESRKKHGGNQLTPHDVNTFWDELLDNFKDPTIIILCIALLITVGLAVFRPQDVSWYEGVGIAAAVLIATLVSTYSTFRNEQTFQKLQEEASRIDVKAYRNGRLISLPIDQVVVGDLIVLQPGDMVPADGVLTSGKLKVNQSALTGESQPVKKIASSIEEDFSDFHNEKTLFRGTTIDDGEAVIEVMRVGDNTVLGNMAREFEQDEIVGPLQAKLKVLANDIAKVAYIGAILIALVYFFKVAIIDNNYDQAQIASYFNNFFGWFKDFIEALILAIVVIVVIVPEGLPMMIAMVLARNMRKLLTSQVLVRQNVGIETAGSLNLLFCDKTGTMTRGKLEPAFFCTLSDSEEMLNYYSDFNSIPSDMKELLEFSIRENTTCVVNLGSKNRIDCLVGGNATEKALLLFIGADKVEKSYQKASLTNHISFNSTIKYSASELHKDDKDITVAKGAPEVLINNCTGIRVGNDIKPLTDETRNKLIQLLDGKAEDGYRLIAFTYKDSTLGDNDTLPDDMAILGFIGIRDALRPETKMAVQRLQQAGIHVVMSTGDRIGTAKAIARDIDLYTNDVDIAIESDDLGKLSDEDIKALLPNLKIVSRCKPADKKRLVKLAKEMGLVVGMTGDGVNDAAALLASDIAFGIGSGTEVAKEASHLIILDDNIHSITKAVHYGRSIYRSIQKFVNYQLTVNCGAILILILGPFFGVKKPLDMTQLLWINLIMDTLAALALSGEPPLDKHMREKPKRREERIINSDMWSSIFAKGIYVAAFSMLFIVFLNPSIPGTMFYQNEPAFLTAFFSLFVFFNLFNALNSREEGLNIFSNITKNKGFMTVFCVIFIVQLLLIFFGGKVFRTTPLPWQQIILLLAMAATIIPFDLIRKGIRNAVTA